MSKYRELELLKEQEHTLLQLHMSFNDQLNRLKVEELALTNLLRLQKEREMQAQTGATEQVGPAEEAIEQETMEVLNLLVSDNPADKEAEEEEEEEEDEEDLEEGVLKKEGEAEGQISEEEEEEANASYNEQLATYLEDLYQQQQQNQQEQLALSANHMEQEEDDDDEEDT